MKEVYSIQACPFHVAEASRITFSFGVSDIALEEYLLAGLPI